MAMDLPREMALKIIYDINEKGAYSNITINKYLSEQNLKPVDKAFITDLVYGTIKWKLSIDYIIGQFSSVKIKKISPWILNVLRLGVYQLIYTDKIPESAACNESVKLAKRYGHAASSRFVNAVLRNVAKNKININYPDKNKENVKYLSVKHSHPEWMIAEWVERFGNEFTESLLEANNSVPEFTVRVNNLKTSKEKLVETLRSLGYEVQDGKYINEALIIKNPQVIYEKDVFQNGYFQVQDESSMLVAKVLDPQPGETVLDVCSAPGGKASHMAQLMQNKGRVIARDIHEHKIKLIDDAVKRLGFSIVNSEIFDATKVDDRYIGKVDRVLVDAPCTGLGIIKRKPDIKWSRNLDDKKEIINLQYQILKASSNYVKPGGFLVYSTCTIEREENEEMVLKFLSEDSEFALEDISEVLPASLNNKDAKKGYIQLFPNIDYIDGFFIAKMKRRG